jgi:integrase
MAKKIAGLDSPAKRARLKPSKNPVWVSVGGSRSGDWLGYRRPVEGAGTWVAKMIADKRKIEARLAQADDVEHTTGALDYAAAAAAALAWAKARRAEISAAAAGAVPEVEQTVKEVIDAYLTAREKRSTTRGHDARWRMTKHVLSDEKLAPLPLSKATPAVWAGWRRRIPGDLQPATVNRLLNDVRAAMATAYPGGVLPAETRAKLKAEAGATVAREVKTLPASDIMKLNDAAASVDAHFGRLVMVLAATGARLSQVARITVADVQTEALRIMMPASAKGRATKARTPHAVPIGADILARLKPALEGRAGNEILLTQKSGDSWTVAAQMQRPWTKARIAAGLPAGTVPYDLRHSSIVRTLGAGVPIRFVAMMHDTSVAMIEAHYSRFITSEVEAAARGAIVPLVSAEVAWLRVVP